MSALLTADQAAMQLKVSARTVRRMCAAGILPYERQTGRRGGRSGGVYLIPQEALHLVKSKSTQQRANPSAKESQPINIGTFLARGGTEAFRTALARRELIEAARSYDGPHRTQYLKALAAQAGIHLSTLYRWMDLKGEAQGALERAVRTIRPKFDERGMRRRTSIEPEAREFFQAMWLQLNKPPVTLVIEKYYKPKALAQVSREQLDIRGVKRAYG